MKAVLAGHWIGEAVFAGAQAGGRDDEDVDLVPDFWRKFEESQRLFRRSHAVRNCYVFGDARQ